jgi:hypothetical protein
MRTRYDIESIEKKQKQEMFCSALWFIFDLLLLTASITLIFTKGENPVWFVISGLCAITSLALLFREKKNAKFGNPKTDFGTVKRVHLLVFLADSILTRGIMPC